MERITVTVLNWEKFNPRKDIKNPSWFALSNRLLEDPDFFEFSPLEFKALIYVFSQASKKNSATVTLNLKHADKVCGLPLKIMTSAIEKMSNIGCVRVCTESVRVCTESGSDTTLHNNTRHNITNRTRPYTAPPAAFDFETLYKKFPRHEGKDAGFKNLAEQIKTDADFAAFAAAVDHYAAIVARRKTEPKFVKLWSTFVGTKRSGYPWREFIDRPAELDAVGEPGIETSDERILRMAREMEAYKIKKAAAFGETAS